MTGPAAAPRGRLPPVSAQKHPRERHLEPGGLPEEHANPTPTRGVCRHAGSTVQPRERTHLRPMAPPRAEATVPVTLPGGPPPGGARPGEAASGGAADAAIAELAAEGGAQVGPSREGSAWWGHLIAAGRGRLVLPIATAAAMASAGAVARAIHVARKGRGRAGGPSRPLASAS